MTNQSFRDLLERRQIVIYFGAVVLGALIGAAVPAAMHMEPAINPALALMLFVTFLQVPVSALGQALRNVRFLISLLVANFVVIPLVVLGLLHFAPVDPLVRLGVLIVLLCPCIDYVVTFSHLGRSDSRLLLAATPALLVVQMALLPVYLNGLLGDAASGLVRAGPFLHAFLWLIVCPFVLAGCCQMWGRRSKIGASVESCLGLAPVPATALVLFIVIASVVPQIGAALGAAQSVLPIYIAFAVLAPIAGWLVAKASRLDDASARAVAFSAATRNSLVVLPLALAIPGAVPLLPAIIVAQTMVELVASLLYIRLMPKLGASSGD